MVFPGTALNMCKFQLWKIYSVFHFVSCIKLAMVPALIWTPPSLVGLFKLLAEKERQSKGIIWSDLRTKLQ